MLVGVLLGSAERDHGVRRLWKALRHDAPDPRETAAARGVSPDGEPLAQVFKTPARRPYRQALLCPHLARPRSTTERH